jgi:hypothetical protein
MTDEIQVVSVPSLWEEPSSEAFESAKANFLAGDDDDHFKVEEKNSEDPVF